MIKEDFFFILTSHNLCLIIEINATKMKHIELDIDTISQMGEEKEDENFDFRAFLKGQDSEKVDLIAHRLNREITAQIDCQKCGNCCESLRPDVSNSEIDRLSKLDNISREDFVSQFIEQDDMDGANYLKDIPCKYLKDKSCSIYSDRPENCKSYPYLHKKGFTSRTFGVIDNYAICPIVYNVYEQLKEELDYL